MRQGQLTNKRKLLAVAIAGSIIFVIAFIVSGAILQVIPPVIAIHGENVAMHNHAMLTVIVDDQAVQLPPNIGLANYDQSYQQYGVSGFAPIHTHDSSGMLHIESKVSRTFTLGDFINIWGVTTFDRTDVELVTQNGIVEDYRNYELKDGDQLILRAGTSS